VRIEFDEGSDAQPLRIVLVTNTLARAGAEKQLVSLAAALRRRRHEVTVLSILEPTAYEEELSELGIPVVRARPAPIGRGVTSIVSGARVLRRCRPDVVVSFVYQANVLARVAGRFAGVPVVISSMRNEHFGGRGARRDRVLRLTDRLATISTTNSVITAQRIVARGVVDAQRLVVIPNAIDVQEMTPSRSRAEVRDELGVPHDAFFWLSVGRLEPQKDHMALLSALSLIQDRSGVHVAIAGRGAERANLERAVRELKLGDQVHLLGLRADIADLLGASDAFVLSSRYEGLPNVVMEAMAAGRPVVGTDVGGMSELVRHGVSGYLVAPRAPMRLSEAMETLMRLPDDARTAMGLEGRAALAHRHAPSRVMDQWIHLIERHAGRATTYSIDLVEPTQATSLVP
jgi:glycosyltransferase involved in cell wall biosynthesis